MSLFKNIFGGSSDKPREEAPSGNSTSPSGIRFGRYTDANKNAPQLKSWEESLKLFGEKKHIDAHEAFFRYLRDEQVGNVDVKRTGDRLEFAIHQGSKIVKGVSEGDKVSAEVNIARFEKPSVAFMRRLMDQNFTFQYSRFALKDDLICMKFSSHMIDASPNKMYYSLKELSTKADRQDNLLTDEFQMLKAVDVEHVEQAPESEKEIKYKYLVKWITEAIAAANQLDEVKFGGAISFIFLNVAYKIDYLLCPEGGLMTDMEKIHGIYFAKDNKPYEEKNRAIIAEFNKILAKPKEFFFESFYRTKATFGLVSPSDQKTVADLVYNECANTNWYRDNNYPNIVRVIYEYIPGYCLFNYGMYRASIGIFHLLMEIHNQDFFTELGFEPVCGPNGIPDRAKVDARIAAIIRAEKPEFPNLDFVTKELNYNSFNEFCASFLKEVDYLNFSKQPVTPTQN